MGVARVVQFEDVSADRVGEMKQRMQSGEPPEGLPSMELLWLHDSANSKSLVIQLFDSQADLDKAAAVLEAMPADETPGTRTSVTTYDVTDRRSM
jgi:hypothetical protein